MENNFRRKYILNKHAQIFYLRSSTVFSILLMFMRVLTRVLHVPTYYDLLGSNSFMLNIFEYGGSRKVIRWTKSYCSVRNVKDTKVFRNYYIYATTTTI